jgi:hypothetical protein
MSRRPPTTFDVAIGLVADRRCAFQPARRGGIEVRKHFASLAVLLITSTATAGTGQAVVKTVEPDVLQGRVRTLSLADGLTVEVNGSERHIPLADLVRLTFPGEQRPLGRRDSIVTLRNGDVFRGRITGGEDDAIDLESSDLGPVRLMLEVMDRLDTPLSSDPGFTESVQWFDQSGNGREDRVLLTNGDVVRGFITKIDDQNVVVDSAMGEARLAHRLIVALRFAAGRPENLQSRSLKDAGQGTPPHVILTLRSGERVTAQKLNLADEVAHVSLWAGPEVTIQTDRIARVEFVGGRWEWLSDHTPISFEHSAMLSLPWEYQPNRNVLGNEITVAGERFERGIGVHSRSSLIYETRGEYEHLVTSFGMDDNSGPLADVTVNIYVDGQRQFSRENVSRGRLHGPIRLTIPRANRVELQVDFGLNGDIQDRFNWVESALIR